MIFQIIIFALITRFYIAYFYKQIQLQGKGIETNRLAKGSKPKRTRTIEMCLLIATYGTAIIQYASIFFSSFMFPLSFKLSIQTVGITLAACGVVFFLLALVTMRDNWRAGVDESQSTNIVTGGIYKYSRNPAFVGFDLLYIGTALAVPNIVMVISTIISICLLHLQILEEEKYLPSVFGGEYVRYKRETPRYFLFF